VPTLEEDLETLRIAYEDGDKAAAVAALGLLFRPSQISSSSQAAAARGPVPLWLLTEIIESVAAKNLTPAGSRRSRERWNDQIRCFWVKLLRVRGVKWDDVYEQTAIELRRLAPESAAGAKAIKDSYLRERRRWQKRARAS
jgi:hypothetical protein